MALTAEQTRRGLIMKWIDVKVKLPEHNSSCLVTDGATVSLAIFHNDFFLDLTTLGCANCGCDKCILTNESSNITHWMETPEPPPKTAIFGSIHPSLALNIFMGILRKGKVYVSEDYKNAQASMIAWLATLTAEQQNEIEKKMPSHIMTSYQADDLNNPDVKKWMFDYYMQQTARE